MASRILVTGSAGFLGSHLCERLAADGHRVFGVDNMLGGDVENMTFTSRLAFVRADCCDFEHMNHIFDGVKPDIVYHLAAAPHEGLSVFSPSLVTRHTYLSTVSVASAAIAHGVKRFVFCSSMARYGKGSPGTFHAFEEWMAPAPVDPYGIAKVASEDVLKCLGRAHGMEVVVLVPHNIYGERQRYCDPFRNVASIMCNLMLQGRQPFIYGDGYQTRCFSYVEDCIEPMVRAGFADVDGETINIGPDTGEVTINKLARMLADIIGFDMTPTYLPDRPCEVKIAWPSSEKSRRMLGYDDKTSLHDGLVKLVKWIKNKGPKPFAYHLGLEIVTDKTPRTWKERLF